VDARDEHDTTPLLRAVLARCPVDIARAPVTAGADVNAKTKTGYPCSPWRRCAAATIWSNCCKRPVLARRCSPEREVEAADLVSSASSIDWPGASSLRVAGVVRHHCSKTSAELTKGSRVLPERSSERRASGIGDAKRLVMCGNPEPAIGLEPMTC
jgi:hypothetical protein